MDLKNLFSKNKAAASGEGLDTLQGKVGAYYSAYMDEEAINARGLEPAQPYLDRIASLDHRFNSYLTVMREQALADDEQRHHGDQRGIGKARQEVGAGHRLAAGIGIGKDRKDEEKSAERGRRDRFDGPALQGIAHDAHHDQRIGEPDVQEFHETSRAVVPATLSPAGGRLTTRLLTNRLPGTVLRRHRRPRSPFAARRNRRWRNGQLVCGRCQPGDAWTTPQ